MRKRKKAAERSGFMKNLSIFLSFLLLLLLTGCVPPGEVLRFVPESDDSVRIGVLLPVSGPNAARGRKMLEGARFAADELNSRRGHFGRQVELLAFDTAGTEEGARQALKAAVSAGAVGVVGGYSTGETRVMADLAIKNRVPLVVPMATGNDDVIGVNSFVYRVAFTDKQQSEMLAGYMRYYRQVKRLIVTVSSDPSDVYSRNVARDTAASFREVGGEVASVCEINDAAPEKHLIDAMSFAPEAILLPFEGKKAARYFKILRQSGYMGIICGPDSWDDPAFFKELQGVKNPGLNFYTAFFSDSARHSEYRSFKENFRKKCYYYPGSCEIQTFDAINTLLAGLGNNASSLKKFDRNWRSLRKYAGAAAIYTMLPKNQIDRTIYINRVGVSQTDRKRLVPGNITGLQYSRLKVYDVDDE